MSLQLLRKNYIEKLNDEQNYLRDIETEMNELGNDDDDLSEQFPSENIADIRIEYKRLNENRLDILNSIQFLEERLQMTEDKLSYFTRKN